MLKEKKIEKLPLCSLLRKRTSINKHLVLFCYFKETIYSDMFTSVYSNAVQISL